MQELNTRVLKLKEIASTRSGVVLSRFKGNIHYEKHFVYKSITLKSFSSSGKLNIEYLDEYVAHSILPSNYFTSEGDILIRLREPNDAILIDKYCTGLVVPSFVAIIQFFEKMSQISLEYFTYYFNSNLTKKKLYKEIQGTTIPMIQINDLLNLTVQLPPLETQHKIVSFLQGAQKETKLLEELIQLKKQHYTNLLDIILKKGE